MNTFNAWQLEQKLAQQIERLYVSQLGHQPSEIACKFLDGQQELAIFIKGSLTKPEQLLVETQQFKSAVAFRDKIEDALRPRLKALIEQTTHMAIADLLFDTHIPTQNSSAIAILIRRKSASA
jgi:uncharacterized protein YbcI